MSEAIRHSQPRKQLPPRARVGSRSCDGGENGSTPNRTRHKCTCCRWHYPRAKKRELAQSCAVARRAEATSAGQPRVSAATVFARQRLDIAAPTGRHAGCSYGGQWSRQQHRSAASAGKVLFAVSVALSRRRPRPRRRRSNTSQNGNGGNGVGPWARPSRGSDGSARGRFSLRNSFSSLSSSTSASNPFRARG